MTSSQVLADTTRYRQPGSRSRALFDRAQHVLPGGSSRTTIFRAPFPPYITKGWGANVIDIDGDERIDFVNNYTALIHGHAHPVIQRRVVDTALAGASFSFPTAGEIELAERLTGRIPAAERARFTNSGTEAVMLAIRIARAVTGRDRIAKFEGAYHGFYDEVNISQTATPAELGSLERPKSVSARGLSRGSADAVLTLPFNQTAIATALIEEHALELAAVIVDPSPMRAGMPEPRPEFFQALRAVTRRHGIALIFDEVITFRVGLGGMQERLGVEPDLTTLGKIIGGGFPVGAVVGRAALMDELDPRREVSLGHGGTFNANPVTMAAGAAALDLLSEDEFARINSLAVRLGTETTKALTSRGYPCQVHVLGSLFMVHLRGDEVADYRSLRRDVSARDRAVAFAAALLDTGIVLAPNGMGCVSTPMTNDEIEAFVGAALAAAERVYEGASGVAGGPDDD